MRRLLGRLEQWRPWPVAALALVSYVPLLLTHRGQVGADTKSYLYLNPGKLLADAPWLWETGVGLGTVTHQNIGYLWPSGPYYWFFDTLGVPDWIAQRLWLGTIILAAGMGVRFMLRTLRWELPGVTVAMFAYALSPYLLHYGARISIILLPFAGLPWLIAFTVRALRNGGWRDPAAFALITLTVGGINATSLLLVLIGPALWVLYALLAEREVTLRQVLAAGARIGSLTLATSLWWMAGLVLQGNYGIPILDYTETYRVVGTASTAPEVMRGLGYWFFYGSDALGPWISGAVTLVQNPLVLTVSFILPGLVVISALFTRFRYRAYFVLMAVVGALVSIASHPYDSPTPAGALFKAATATDAGLAFRSTPRAIPLLALGGAVLLAAGVAGVATLRPRLKVPAAMAVVVLVGITQAPLFLGRMVDDNLQRAEDIPSYWYDVAERLDSGDRSTRVLEMPGIDFASYRWGNTVDPITPGLIDRDFAARELIPYGSPASAQLMMAVDLPYQEGTANPAALGPVLRMMSVGDVVARNDLRYGRYRTPRPRKFWEQLTGLSGLGGAEEFGPKVSDRPDPVVPLLDEIELGMDPELPDPPSVGVLPVTDPLPMLRTQAASAPLIIAGDAHGLVNTAGAGMLDPARPVFYSASFADAPDELRSLADEPQAELIVTDTNRKQALRWGSVRENRGYTERADREPIVTDVTDNRLEVFPDADTDAATVTETLGGATIDSTTYGNGVSYTPGDKPQFAMDGSLRTAWRTGAFGELSEDALEVTWDEAVTADSLTLTQSQRKVNRWMTEVELSFDDGDGDFSDPQRVRLDERSRGADGQPIEFPRRTFSRLRVEIIDTNVGELANYSKVSEVGIAELSVADTTLTDVVRPPTDLLDTLGGASTERPLAFVLRRASANPEEVVLDDEEPAMIRSLSVPEERQFSVGGVARLPLEQPDQDIDATLGIPSAEQGGVTATSKARLPNLRARSASANDGDPTTAWQGPVNQGAGLWLEYSYPQPIRVDELEFTYLNDGRHSTPASIHLEVDGATSASMEVPEVPAGAARGATTTATLRPPEALRGSKVRLVIDEIRPRATIEWFSHSEVNLPVGIAEVGWGGPLVEQAPAKLPAACRDDLLRVDDQPVGVMVEGTRDAALDRQPLALRTCALEAATDEPGGPSADADPALTLRPEPTMLRTGLGLDVGMDLDELWLRSAAGGDPVELPANPSSETPAQVDPSTVAAPEPPDVETRRTSRLTYTADVSGASESYWVVMGQSFNPGWTLRTSDGDDLGPPTLVNGFANGWRIDPASVGTDASFVVEWAPQRTVWVALSLSAIGVVLTLLVLIFDPHVLSGRRRGGSVRVSRVLVLRPTDGFGSALTWGRATALALMVLATGVVAFGPVVGFVVGAMALVVLRRPSAWPALRFLGVGAYAAGALWVVGKQLRNAESYDLGFEWPNLFPSAHGLVLAALAMMALDVLVEGLLGGWRRSVDVDADGEAEQP
ncbi:MAG: alpha-(1-_3)-arabinofuranosyltransferase family protein [Microthrixaceae bacterium]